MKFEGRDQELAELTSLWERRGSSFVVCRGRRRIGKSTLIEEFALRSRCCFVEISGLPPDDRMTNQRELDSFCGQLALQTGKAEVRVGSWQKAFALLADAVKGRKKTVVLLDEISWMGKYDPSFPGELKNLWDLHLSHRSNLVFFVCGSVSAWIQQNILNNTGFVGRIALEFVLDELKLKDCLKFWGRAGHSLSVGEFFDVLSVTGGVPRYLEEINPRLSAEQNIKRMCFSPNGFLFKDFKSIFNDVFGESHVVKRQMLTCLRDGAKSVSEIAAAINRTRGGFLSENLEELEKAGFVARDEGLNPSTGKAAQEVRYRIKDNYTRFYLRYVEPHAEAIEKGLYRPVPLSELPEWDSIMGLQFESMIVGRIADFFEYLDLDRARVESVAPYRRQTSADDGHGVQIDLLIQTPRSVYVVEIKRKKQIGLEIIDEVEEKVHRLHVRSGISVRTALVYQGRLDPRVREEGYFSAIVSAEKLLGKR
mgnify:CR=1 FL=1